MKFNAAFLVTLVVIAISFVVGQQVCPVEFVL
jgi:hypothetical protein